MLSSYESRTNNSGGFEQCAPLIYLKLTSKIGLIIISLVFTTGASALPAWDNYQGNAAHRGYVPVKFTPSYFRTVWSWVSPHRADGVTPFINPVTVSGGRIAVTDDDYHSPQALHVIDESSGVELWSYEFPSDTPGLNPATINNGFIYAATSGHEATFMHKFDATTGALLWKTPFSAQWEHYLAPTVFRNMVVTAGGYYGGMYSFRKYNGNELWFASSLPQVDMFTPAVDADNAYVYTTNRLNIVNRLDGSVTTIADPSPDSTCCYGQHAAPILTTRQRVIALSGDSFSGRASSSTGGYYSRSLVSFDLVARSLEWRTQYQYITQPALAHGRVYAGSSSPLRMDAINEVDGQISWAWIPKDGSTQFCRNVIATNSHIFVSTDRAVHAISLKTRKSQWSIPVPGELALSDRGTLVINEGCRESTGRVVAVKLVP